MPKLIVAFRNFANAPDNRPVLGERNFKMLNFVSLNALFY